MEHILVVDVGTSSLKAMLYDRAGKLLNRASQEYHSEFTENNYVEQSSFTWKSALLSSLKQTGEFLNARGIGVEAIAVTSQRASVIPIDGVGRAFAQRHHVAGQTQPAAVRRIAAANGSAGYLSPHRSAGGPLFFGSENDVAAGRASRDLCRGREVDRSAGLRRLPADGRTTLPIGRRHAARC